MVPFVIFVAGVAVGIASRNLYEILKNNSDVCDKKHADSSRPEPQQSTHTADASTFDISPLEPIMRKYGVDISVANCLYILCNKIKSCTYKKLLDDIVVNTKSGEDLISFINNVHIETFTYPNITSSDGAYFVPLSSIDHLLAESTVIFDTTDPRIKVETLINLAYASAVDRLKKNFGTEFSKLIKAYEEGRELQSFYNDIIKEIKISRDFMTGSE